LYGSQSLQVLVGDALTDEESRCKNCIKKEFTNMTDVRLDEGSDGSFIVLEGRVVKAAGSDFMLDSPERRIGRNPFRRALVHDQDDSLTVNFANDYKGGVTLNAVRELSPRQIPKDKFSIRLDPTPILVVHGGIQFEVHSESLLSAGDVLTGGGGIKITTLSLIGELTKLQDQISALQAKVTALEAKQ
jgi:hypothetical protein